MRLRLVAVLSACLALPAGAVVADDCLPRVEAAWVRLPPSAMPMAAAFARLRNDCAVPVRVVGADSPAFAAVELHETRVVEGVNRMRPVPVLEIAPGEVAVLRPGGLHLMLLRPQSPLAEGAALAVEFRLDDGRRVSTRFEVRRTAPEPSGRD